MKTLKKVGIITLVAVMLFSLVAFAACSHDPAEELIKLEEKGYVVYDDAMANRMLQGAGYKITTVLNCTKTIDGDRYTLYLVYFESASDAKANATKIYNIFETTLGRDFSSGKLLGNVVAMGSSGTINDYEKL